jgi:lipoprotein-releasing system permease protein
MFGLPLFIGLRHLVARPRQTLVAVAAMALATGIVVTLTALMTGFEWQFVSETLKLSAHVTVTDEELRPAQSPLRGRLGDGALVQMRDERPADRPRRIRRAGELARAAAAMPEVAEGARQLVGQVVITLGDRVDSVDLRGLEPAAQDRVTPLRGYVKSGSYGSLDTNPDAILLGTGVAERIGARVGDRLTAVGPHGERLSLTISGLVETGVPPIDKTRALVRLKTAQSVLGRPEEVNAVVFRLRDPEQAPQVAARLRALSGHRVETWREQNANWLNIFAFQRTITKLVVAFLVLVAAFGVLNILIMVVLEKKRDIAILRSVGLDRGQIVTVFLWQGTLLGVVGAVVGCALGAVLIALLRRLPVHMEGIMRIDHLVMFVRPWYYVVASFGSMAAALLASALPSLSAAKTDPVDVLRGQT